MEFWKPGTEYYGGIDLHDRNMYLCVVDRSGEKYAHRRMRNDAELFLRVIERYLPSITIAVECTGTWYWLADLCADHEIAFALGHVSYMRAIHGAKAKNDRIDSEKIARLVQAGLLPKAYAYPRGLRATRDLLRRRLRLVRIRAGMANHVRALDSQDNLHIVGQSLKSKSGRAALPAQFAQEDVSRSVATDIEMMEHLEHAIGKLERHILARVKDERTTELALLQTTPGVGEILALTILLEMDTVDRFPTRQKFASYSRLVRCDHVSDGKPVGSGPRRIGNPYLRWAFGEVAVFAAQYSKGIRSRLERLTRRHGKGKAKTLLAHKFGRAIYYMLKRKTAFDKDRFLNG